MITIKASDLDQFEMFCEVFHIGHRVEHVDPGVETIYWIEPRYKVEEVEQLFELLKD